MCRKRSALRSGVMLMLLLMLTACNPSDRRPGLWLTGNEVATFPADWRFTDDIKEIAIEVDTPYGISHSITIWCGQVDGRLFIGASAPDTKRWPAWANERPDVRIMVGDDVYDARLRQLTDAAEIGRLGEAMAKKYQLERPAATDGSAPPRNAWYWAVEPRA